MDRPKPWRMDVGVLSGLAVGALIWWNAYEPALGIMQKPQLLLVPAAIGALVVAMRNKRKKAGPYDPNTVSENERGRL